MMQQIENEYDEECLWYDSVSLNGCDQDKVMTDVLGMTWCEDHAYRGNLINWLARHGWTELKCPPDHPYPAYSIGPSAYCAAMAVIQGTDDFIGLAVATTEMLDEQEVA